MTVRPAARRAPAQRVRDSQAAASRSDGRQRAEANPPLDRGFTYRFNVLHKAIDRASAPGYLQSVGLSLSDGRCLASIGSFAPLSIKELAGRSHLNKSQASRAAQALVDKGYIHKGDSPDDGRGVVLTLTDAGRAKWRQTMEFVDARNREIVGCLSADECATLSELLDRLIRHNHPSTEAEDDDSLA